MRENRVKKSTLALMLIAGILFHATCAPQHALAAPDETTGDAKSGAAFMGAGSCSSSNCHGSTQPRTATNVLQNEFVTWQRHDQHAKAWTTLTSADSKIIGQHLGIAAPQKEPLCLRCHATFDAIDGRQGNTFTIEDGVSCETCHGAAEKFLGPHAARDATHQSNLEYGMRELVAPQQRAQLCLSCHYGNEQQAVTHRLIGAGHPRLTFELDTFGALQPVHWKVDDDYRSRKAAYEPVRAWLVGQAARATAQLDQLLSPTRSHNGVWPEFTTFSCYSCHHSLEDGQWKNGADYHGHPGDPVVNLSSIEILQRAMSVLDQSKGEEIARLMAQLQAELRSGQDESLNKLRKVISASATTLSSVDLKGKGAALAQSVIELGSMQQPYEVAEQIAMGLSSISSAFSADGSWHKADIDSLYAALSKPNSYQPKLFTAAANKFAKNLTK